MKKYLSFLEKKTCRLLISTIQIFSILILYFFLKINLLIDCVGKMSSLLLIFSALWLVLRAHLQKNKVLLVFFIFIALYSFPTKLFFFDGIPFAIYNLNYTYDTAILTTLIFTLFYAILNLFLYIGKQNEQELIVVKRNDLFFWGAIFIGFYIVQFMLSGDYLLSGAVYGHSEKQVSSFNEYVIILFLLAYIYSGKKKLHIYILYLLISFYIIKNLLLGGRIESVLVLLAFFIIRFQYVFSYKKILLLMLGGVLIMNVIGNLRSNPMAFLEGEASIMDFFKIDVSNKLYQGSNEGDVFWASERILLLIDKGHLDLIDRLKATFDLFFSPFVSEPMVLSTYGLNIEKSGGGGLAPIFFYAFLGLLGVVLFSYFISLILNGLNKNISQAFKFYIVLLIATTPRWFVYYPIFIVKFCLIGFILFKLSTKLTSLLKDKRCFLKTASESE